MFQQWIKSRSNQHPSLTHSLIQTSSIAPLQVHYYSEALPTQHGYCVGEFHAEASHGTAREGRTQGPYVMARAGSEPTTLRTKGDESTCTNEPPRPTNSLFSTLSKVLLKSMILHCIQPRPFNESDSGIERNMVYLAAVASEIIDI